MEISTSHTSLRSDLVKTFHERGFIHQATDLQKLDGAAAEGVVTAYIGFDATAPSLHVGNLTQIMMLRWLQKTGHRPIVLMGGGTTKVGDPSGKDASRSLLDETRITANIASIRTVFGRLLDFHDGPTGTVMLDNDAWLSGYGYLEFLRTYGPHFTINRMLTFDSVRLRLEREQPLSFLEFNYMLMQAVDYLELNRRTGCSLQMGGSDQWGNIVNGVELVRRVEGREVFGLTTPLITTAGGAKMGKTAAGAVWLNADMLSPYDYWQFWRNTADADVGRFLRLFTELELDEIARLEALPGADINAAKIVLANEATALVHGREAAVSAAATAESAFVRGEMSSDLPTVEISRAQLEAGVPLPVLASQAGLTASSSEARRLLAQGGLRLNDIAETEVNRLVTLADLGPEGAIKLAAGKKKIVLVRPM